MAASLPAFRHLRARFAALRRRRAAAALVPGAVRSTTVLASVTLLGAAVDAAWELSAESRVLWLGVAGILSLALLLAAALKRLAVLDDGRVAREMDRAGGTGGVILCGLELGARPFGPSAALSESMRRLAVSRAVETADSIPAAMLRERHRLGAWYLALLALGVCCGLAWLAAPGLSLAAWLRFTDPHGGHAPFDAHGFVVRPAGAAVLYGESLDIETEATGVPPASVDLVVRHGGAEAAQPMVESGPGRWHSRLEGLTEPLDLCVRGRRGRSRWHRVRVLYPPRIESVRYRIEPPAYTRLMVREAPLGDGRIEAVSGSRVRVTATSNRPLAAARFELSAAGTPPETFSLEVTPRGTTTVSYALPLELEQRFRLTLVDVEGLETSPPAEGLLVPLPDGPPAVAILAPGERSFAPPSAPVPVAVEAFDDHGLVSVRLMRSLNGSPWLPLELVPDGAPPARLSTGTTLELALHGLSPGDRISLFALARDGDPAGAKTADSEVVHLTIIDEEALREARRKRMKIKELVEDYRHSREELADAIEAIRETAQALPGDDPPDAARGEAASRLARLSKRLSATAERIGRRAGESPVFELQEELRSHLQGLAAVVDTAAERLGGLGPEDVPAAARRALDEESRLLRAALEAYDRDVSRPLDTLEKVAPIQATARRLAHLHALQEDLAEKSRALLDMEDGRVRRRMMRQLAQRQIDARRALELVLSRLLEQAYALPEEPALNMLRLKVDKLVYAFRRSGVLGVMDEAAVALDSFDAGRGHERARRAEEIIRELLEGQKEVCDQAGESLQGFPSLGDELSRALEQSMPEELESPSPGAGGRSGYQERSTLPDVSLYGPEGLVGSGESESTAPASEGERHRWTRKRGGAPGASAPQAEPAFGGVPAEAIPPAYRERVRIYFQRVLDRSVLDEGGAP